MPKKLKHKTKKSKRLDKNQPMLIYVVSALKGFLVCIVGFSLLALIFMKNGSFNVFVKIMIYLIIGLGAFSSGFISNKKVRDRGVKDGLLASLFYSVIIFLFCLIIMRFNVSINILLIILIGVLSGLSGGIVSANR